MNHQFSALHKLDELRGNLAKDWLAGQELWRDTVDFHSANVDVSLRINVLVVVSSGDSPVHQFYATNLDNSVTLGDLEPGGLGI